MQNRYAELTRDPLTARAYAQFADDGMYTITFTDAKEAHAWLVKFSRATAREQKKAEKEFSLEGREAAMNFTTRRRGERVTVRYIPKTCPVVADSYKDGSNA